MVTEDVIAYVSCIRFKSASCTRPAVKEGVKRRFARNWDSRSRTRDISSRGSGLPASRNKWVRRRQWKRLIKAQKPKCEVANRWTIAATDSESDQIGQYRSVWGIVCSNSEEHWLLSAARRNAQGIRAADAEIRGQHTLGGPIELSQSTKC